MLIAMQQSCVEARAGIEPAYTDLQSAASPLRHRAERPIAEQVGVRRKRPTSASIAAWQWDSPRALHLERKPFRNVNLDPERVARQRLYYDD